MPINTNIYKRINPFFTKKIHIFKWRVNLSFLSFSSLFLLFSLYFALFHFIFPLIFAADSPWPQTDWSGGQSSATVSTTVSTFSSVSNLDTSSAGQLSLDIKSDWLDSSWKFRKKITFDNTSSHLGVTSENLSDFPVLVKLDPGSDIDYSKTLNNGEDIRFTDSDGTTSLSYEIESWNESGSSYVWVKVPQVDQNSDSDSIYIYYGNPDASDGQNPQEVWDDGFAMVYHFNEPAGTTGNDSVNDSAGNTSGTPSSGISFNQTGQIGTTADFSSSTGISLGIVGPSLLTNATSLSFWINTSNFASPTRQNPFEQAYGGWGTMTIETNGIISWFFGSHGANSSPYGSHQSSSLMNNNEWINVTAVRNPNDYTYKWYKNGTFLNGGTYNSSYPTIIDRPFTIGDGYVNRISGKLDEFRVSNTVRSQAWIAASYKSETDDYNTFSSEEGRYMASGELVSNTFDAEFATDWGTMVYNYSSSGSASVKIRTDSSDDMSGADDWSSCSAISSGSDISSNSCVSDTDQYLQYQIALTPSNSISPIFEDITISFAASDQISPTVNGNTLILSGAEDGEWTNSKPSISWSPGQDNPGGNGLLGYCVSLDEADLGSPNNLDPSLTSGSLSGIDDGISQDYCPFISSSTTLNLASLSNLNLSSGKQYYFSLKAVDLAGNIWAGDSEDFQNLVSFKFDNLGPSLPSYISLPGSFLSTKNVTFIWPYEGPEAAADSHSGLAGLQYRIGQSGTWYGDLHLGSQDISDLLVNDGAYTTDETIDYPNINEGINYVYLRAIDNVGNVSSSSVSAVLKINTSSPDPVENLSVSPSNNTSNSYSFDWDVPSSFTGQASALTYCYTINSLPSETSCSFTLAGVTSLPSDAYATQPGKNTLYVVAKDEAGNINYDTYQSVEFIYSGSAPGIPLGIDIADISIKATSNWKLALSWETPSNVGAGVSSYKIFRSPSQASCSSQPSAFSEVGSSSSTSFVDTGLKQQTYFYCLKSCDSANNCSAHSSTVSLLPDGKFTDPPSLVKDPEVFSITTKKAIIEWFTDRDSDSRIQYGKSSNNYFSEEISTSDQTSVHTLTLNNLDPGTTYFYRARWIDEDGNLGTSDEFSFTTSPPPSVSLVKASQINLNSALISFTIKNSAQATILYGKTQQYGGSTNALGTSQAETTYSQQLTGLDDGTEYHYKIVLKDVEGSDYGIEDHTFATVPRPKVTDIRVEEIKNVPQPTVKVFWKSNTSISSIVSYYPEDDPPSLRNEVDVDLKQGDHEMTIQGLYPNKNYSLLVKGRDNLGNEAVSDIHRFTTAVDSRPPEISDVKVETAIISDNSVGGKASAQLVVSWKTDEEATSQVEYGEGVGLSYSQVTQIDTELTSEHVVIISDLEPSKVYHLRPISRDSIGNEGKSLDMVTITSKSSNSALELVINKLLEIFGFLR